MPGVSGNVLWYFSAHLSCLLAFLLAEGPVEFGGIPEPPRERSGSFSRQQSTGVKSQGDMGALVHWSKSPSRLESSAARAPVIWHALQ